MNAYTSLEQSKKLAEILPLESADMRYEYPSREKDEIQEPMNGFHTSSFNWFKESDSFIYFPCWSLAALLEIIPSEIFSGEYIINITEGLDNKWCITYDNIDNKNHSFYGLSSSADNLIDTCYKIILKLHERKLL